VSTILDSVSTQIAVPFGHMVVTHHESVAEGGTPAAVVLREDGVTPNVSTEIKIWPTGEESKSLLLLWKRQSVARGMALLYNPASKILFVGAETIAAAVHLESGKVIGAHTVALFWSFQQAGDFVVELGELECFLRAGTGEILGSAMVDPPYEMDETSEGIRFESPAMGRQCLRFPRTNEGT
jgi:hypothetical protein